MRLALYTAVTSNYDNLRPIVRSDPEVTYVCFCDDGAVAPPGWTCLPCPRGELDPASRNRWAKLHPHLLFPDHDVSIYVDGNLEVVGDVAELAQQALRRSPIALYEHPFRRTQIEEARECARAGLEWLPVIRRQIRRQRAEGFEDQGGLFEANVVVRAHHDPSVIRVMERWWREWEQGAKRDQLGLMYALWKEGVTPHSLGRHDGRFAHEFFVLHLRRRPTDRSALRALRMLLNRIDLSVRDL